MLRQRLLTAAVLIPAMILALWYLPTTAVIVLLGLFVSVGAWEWAGLSGLNGTSRYGYAAFVIAVGVLLMGGIHYLPGIATATFGVAVVWWLWALVSFRWDVASLYRARAGRLITGLFVLIPAWVALSTLHFDKVDANSPRALLYMLTLVAVGDSAAYAAGHLFGRRKLAPSISPGKTWEGVAGAAFAALLLAYFSGTMIWQYSGDILRHWLLFSVVTVLISIIGDLVESKIKRIAGAKDSGSLLPGHGGVLDRIDAMTAAAPFFVLGWLVWFDVYA